MFTNTRSLFFVVLFLCISRVADAQILPSTDSVFFTNVKVGFSRDAFLTIEAQTDLTVTDIKIAPRIATAGEFQIVTPTLLNFPLAKGDRRNLILRCKPSLGNTRTAALTIYTTSGDTTIELIGLVTTKQPDVVTEPDTLDFGTIAPTEIRELPYKIYGAGIDSALITNLFTTNDNGPSIYYEVYAVDPTITFPHKIGPTDTLHMMARFTGYDPVGKKTGRSNLQGDVSGSIHCEFRGAVGKPEMQFSPQLLDLGIVPLGATVDTFIYLRSIGEGAVTVESITPPPSYDVSNIPSLPHDINQADSLKLDISFTAVAPGTFEQPLEAMAKATASGGKFRSALLKAIVLPNQLLVKSPDVLEVPCGIEATYQFTALELSDTSTSPITVHRIVSDNPDVIIVDSASLPLTINAGQTVTLNLDYVHRNNTSDSAIIEIYNGNFVLLRDTVRIHKIEQFIALDAVVANNELRITAKNDIAPYTVDSLVLEIVVDNDDVVDLLINELSLHPSLIAATIKSSYDTANTLYRVEISSPTSIDLFAGDLIGSIPLKHYYAKDSVASFTASAIVPELSGGCLTFTPASAETITPDDCSDAIMRRHLRGERLIGNVTISENPVIDGSATLQCDLLLASQLLLTIYDAAGNVVSEDYQTGLAAGSNHLVLPARSFLSGSYTALLTARNGVSSESVSIPFLVTR